MKLTLIIIVSLFTVILGFFYTFFYFSKLLIIINNDIETFTVTLQDRKPVICNNKSSCEFKIRPKQIISVKIEAENFHILEFTTKGKLFKEQVEKRILIPFYTITKIIREKKARTQEFNVGGMNILEPILRDKNNKFLIFAKKEKNDLGIYIYNNKKQQQKITTLNNVDNISEFSRIFALSSEGIFLPNSSGVLFFDFSIQKKYQIYSGDLKNIKKISLLKKNLYLFQTFNNDFFTLSKEGERTNLRNNIQAVGFINNEIVTYGDNLIYFANGTQLKIRENFDNAQNIRFEDGKLILEIEKEDWIINF